MPFTKYQRLLDRGRKAGLATAELYRALAARPPEGGDGPVGQPDSNGFVSACGPDGRRVYQPVPRLPPLGSQPPGRVPVYRSRHGNGP